MLKAKVHAWLELNANQVSMVPVVGVVPLSFETLIQYELPMLVVVGVYHDL